jgi:hypothetical protein
MNEACSYKFIVFEITILNTIYPTNIIFIIQQFGKAECSHQTMKRYNKFISVSFIKLLDAKFNIEAKG